MELEEIECSFYNRSLTMSNWEDMEDSIALDIYTAASIGCTKRINEILLEQKNLANQKNSGGWTALMYAAYYSHLEIINVLLGLGASVHLRNENGCNALMLAGMCGNDCIVDRLIQAGCILETRDVRDWTALFHGVNSGHYGVVEILLKNKADPNACERSSGVSPLMHAARQGDEVVSRLLLKGGASTTLSDGQGVTAAKIALDSGYPLLANLIQNWDAKCSTIDGFSLFSGIVSRSGSHGSSFCVDNACVIATTLDSLLAEINLESYSSLFEVQSIDLQVFLTLCDADLKECGVVKMGPRRKMTSAIARWHSKVPVRSCIENSYANKLEVEMQELAVQLVQERSDHRDTKALLTQEQELRKVTETLVVTAQGRLGECHHLVSLLLNQLDNTTPVALQTVKAMSVLTDPKRLPDTPKVMGTNAR